MTTVSASEPDRVNRAQWAEAATVHEYTGAARNSLVPWSDLGEQAALGRIADEVRGRPILDIGVGGGRTTTLLRLLSDDYVGIDYTPEMITACRSGFPDLDFRCADVRDLRGFADGRIGLVVFSYNGLDAVSHEDRARALREIARVLAPGGLLQFSTLNLDGPCFGATPWRPAGSHLAATWTPMYRTAMRVLALLRAPVRIPRARRNVRGLTPLRRRGDGWATAPLEAFDFGLLVHYSTLAEVRDELAAAGLDLEVALAAETGLPVTVTDELGGVRYFQLVARKRATASDQLP